MSSLRRAALVVLVAVAACRGAREPGSVRVGVPRYDQFFRDVNALLADAEGAPADAPSERHRERARVLGVQALDLLEEVAAEIDEAKQPAVRAALREAAERLARVR